MVPTNPSGSRTTRTTDTPVDRTDEPEDKSDHAEKDVTSSTAKEDQANQRDGKKYSQKADHDEETRPDHRTPLEKYRPGYLWVSDITRQNWCEQQMLYTFTLPTIVEETPVMVQGTDLHLARELACHNVVNVKVTSSEDIWAIKVLNLNTAVQAFLNGAKLAREVPIFGFPLEQDVFMVGLIDELSQMCTQALSANNLDELMDYVFMRMQMLTCVNRLFIEYVHQDSKETLLQKEVTFCEEDVSRSFGHYMRFWRGHREVEGVDIEEAWKCQKCDFNSVCEWREKKAQEYANRNRRKNKLL
ncbi:hypothetical protein FSP39_000643 [Pinctada imbricata]|uniref:Exonuclease V n=1 Tax=Pinctada imbricata TaxID=66713 RepID=A0AA89BIZ7_PINIB|nr:hypothetical protein FSP39_000643 [Pinctada imbricata]